MSLKAVVLFVLLKSIVAYPPLNLMESGQQLRSEENNQVDATKFVHLTEKVLFTIPSEIIIIYIYPFSN